MACFLGAPTKWGTFSTADSFNFPPALVTVIWASWFKKKKKNHPSVPFVCSLFFFVCFVFFGFWLQQEIETKQAPCPGTAALRADPCPHRQESPTPVSFPCCHQLFSDQLGKTGLFSPKSLIIEVANLFIFSVYAGGILSPDIWSTFWVGVGVPPVSAICLQQLNCSGDFSAKLSLMSSGRVSHSLLYALIMFLFIFSAHYSLIFKFCKLYMYLLFSLRFLRIKMISHNPWDFM